MKRTLLVVVFAFVAAIVFAPVAVAQLQWQQSETVTPAPAEKDDEGQWIQWDDGNNFGSVGLNAGGLFYVASRWEPSDIADYDGMEITKMNIFINNVPTSVTAKIWQGANAGSLVEVMSQSVSASEQSWIEFDLADPYVIDASQELWFGYEVDDPGEGNFAAGRDNSATVDGKGNMVKLGADGEWQALSGFGIDGNWNIHAYLMGGDPPPDGTFMVTFHVDMGPAVAGGFDPQEHNVVLTGSFTGWAEPGTDNSIEMAWTGKSRSKETILYENFDGGAIPDGWLNLDEDGDGNVWTIVTTPGHGPYDGDYAVMSASWAGGTILYPDNWLVTPKLEGVTGDWELSWAVKTQDPAWPSETYDVLISTTDPDPAEFTSIYSETLTDDEWEVHTLSLADFAGESIYIAFRHHDSSDWFQILLDAIHVTGTPGDVDPPDDLIFSATVEVDAGQIQYKYFSDAFGAGWDGGEWTGDPNRVENITEDTEIFNEWGDLIISVVEVEAEEMILKLFPNPTSSHITVESSSLIHLVRVYDITGRMVLQSNVNEFSQTLDVSTLRGGFYLMQIHTTEGIEGRRFHVAR